jgi:hypothetical protein
MNHPDFPFRRYVTVSLAEDIESLAVQPNQVGECIVRRAIPYSPQINQFHFRSWKSPVGGAPALPAKTF